MDYDTWYRVDNVAKVFLAIIINVTMDFLFLNSVHPSWSPLVAGWLLASGWIVEFIIRKHYNLLKAMFFSMIMISILCVSTELFIYLAWSKWNIPYLGITANYIIPILCGANMVANFVLYRGKPPITWSICLVINCLAFAGLLIFKGRSVISEFKKRFHM